MKICCRKQKRCRQLAARGSWPHNAPPPPPQSSAREIFVFLRTHSNLINLAADKSPRRPYFARRGGSSLNPRCYSTSRALWHWWITMLLAAAPAAQPPTLRVSRKNEMRRVRERASGKEEEQRSTECPRLFHSGQLFCPIAVYLSTVGLMLTLLFIGSHFCALSLIQKNITFYQGVWVRDFFSSLTPMRVRIWQYDMISDESSPDCSPSAAIGRDV